MSSQESHLLEYTTRKNEFIESMCQDIQALTARGHPVLIMRQDNAGENKNLEKRLHSADWKLPVKMEYKAANTPQQNALVEVKFTYLAAKAGQPCMLLKCPGTGGWNFSQS
jgi:hypothetical protein